MEKGLIKFMNYTGNTDYKKIQDKQFLTVDSDKISDIIAELNKQDIPYSARYDEKKITVTFTKDDFEKVNAVIDSFKETAPKNIEESSVSVAVRELRKDFLKILENQERLQQLAEEQRNFQVEKQAQKEQSQEPVSETVEQTEPNSQQYKAVESAIDKSKTSLTILTIISTAVIKQEQRIEDLSNLRQISEDKITRHQERIEKLTAKAERLNTTNQMLDELINNKSTPNAVKDSIRAVIRVNERKIAKIRNEKIPKREQKIEKRQSKIERLDKKINLAQCKINRYKSFNQVVTSFSLVNNGDRRKQFSTAMDELHNNSIALLNAKIDNSTATISHLTKTYKENPVVAISMGVPLDLHNQKVKRQRYINKRNKLMGVIVPYVSQPENVQNEAIKQAEAVVNTALSQEQVSAAEVAENVALAPLPSLPEQFIVEPDPIDMSLLPEIAEIMDMSVSELESKPMDIKRMLVLNYTNSSESSIEDIQASLSNIINPNREVEKNIEQSKQERTGVVYYEAYGENFNFKLNEGITPDKVLDILANHQHPELELENIGTQIREPGALAEFEQSEDCTFSIDARSNPFQEVYLCEINDGKGGISEDNRTDENTKYTTYSLNDFVKQKENPLKNAEELVEGNANMIDGIINNEPPKKEEPKPKAEQTEKKPFYFGRSAMNKNAQKIANEHRGQKDKSKEKDPPNHGSL